MRASSSSVCLAFAIVSFLAGCEGPWNGLPAEDLDPIRASLAVFLQSGAAPAATFGRPIAGYAQLGDPQEWIDTSASLVVVRHALARCGDLDTLAWADSFGAPYRIGWERSLMGSDQEACADSIEDVHGRLRWNASLPWNAAGPWLTDSFDVVPEISTSPRFLRHPGLADLAVRWPSLARADSATRVDWASDPRQLRILVSNWNSIQATRGLDSQVLALDTSDWIYRKVDLDSNHLASLLLGRSHSSLLVVVRTSDTFYLPMGAEGWLQFQVRGTRNLPLYEATSTIYPLESVPFPEWGMVGDWVGLDRGRPSLNVDPGDTVNLAFSIFHQPNNGGDFLKLAVAGTCPSQRAWLEGGSTSRAGRPWGNAGPFNGFVCRVSIDTVSFPLGW